MVFAVAAGVQAAMAAFAGDPLSVAMLRTSASGAAAMAAWGIWRGAVWAAGAALAYGLLTSLFLFALGPLLNLDVAARSGLRASGGAVLIFSLATAWYLRRHPSPTSIATERASER